MQVHLERELERLKRDLLTLGSLVETNLSRSITALRERDEEEAKKVLEFDNVIDSKEVELEEACLKILALYQPVAIDLRFVIASLKINNDLERIGDMAVNIANRALKLASKKPVDWPFDYEAMANMAKKMLSDALDSLVQMNVDLANSVRVADDEVDEMNRAVYKTISHEIKKNPELVKAFISYLNIAKLLERIADNATNIAEDVIYMIDGEIVRHRSEALEPIE